MELLSCITFDNSQLYMKWKMTYRPGGGASAITALKYFTLRSAWARSCVLEEVQLCRVSEWLCREGGDLAFKASLLSLAFPKLPTIPLKVHYVIFRRIYWQKCNIIYITMFSEVYKDLTQCTVTFLLNYNEQFISTYNAGPLTWKSPPCLYSSP